MQLNGLTPLSHKILKRWCDSTDRKFKQNAQHLQTVQLQRLQQILQQSTLASQAKVSDYAAFREQFAVTRYRDWRDPIMNCRENGQKISSSKLVRYQPTSGSSEQIKFIPYTQAFLDELDAAIAPWLSSMYRKCPTLASGKHYWSVSWLPESQREVLKDENLNDDSALLGFGKRILSKFTQAVPSDVSFAAQADDALFATLCYLVADQDLAMISVWSPTFALQLMEKLQHDAVEIAQVLRTGQWGARSESLKQVKPPKSLKRAQALSNLTTAQGIEQDIDLESLWPKLCLVSSWDTAGSKQWAAALRAKLPFSQFEGKGLWATEGVVTIPYDGMYPLAFQSHFYEFEYLSGDKLGQVVPSWELELGDQVTPIISSGNGLLRYCLDDCLIVTGFMAQVPCFEFQGRRFGVDLVGEKLAPEVAHQVLQHLSHAEHQAISLLAIDTEQQAKPFYCVLFEGQVPADFNAEQVDKLLRRHFHYELARDLGQLDLPQWRCTDNGWHAYKQLVMKDGMIEGNIKPEPLKKVSLSSLNQLSSV